jgi:hypothetical protein
MDAISPQRRRGRPRKSSHPVSEPDATITIAPHVFAALSLAATRARSDVRSVAETAIVEFASRIAEQEL